jgi:hypothetical protein
MEVSHHGRVTLAPWWCHAIEEPWCRARAVVPRHRGRREEQSHASMDKRERERAVVAALNLGEMEMNMRE